MLDFSSEIQIGSQGNPAKSVAGRPPTGAYPPLPLFNPPHLTSIAKPFRHKTVAFLAFSSMVCEL
jgi:hypothetical protein